MDHTKKYVVQEKLDTVRKFFDKLNKKIEPKEYALRGDSNRMMMPQSLLSKSCIRSSKEMAESLKLNMQIGETYALITRQGAHRQSNHYDTKTSNSYSVIHVITKRFIWLKDNRGEHYVQMNDGDILIMCNNCCHTGAELEYKKKSYALFVPIGYSTVNTFPCCLV